MAHLDQQHPYRAQSPGSPVNLHRDLLHGHGHDANKKRTDDARRLRRVKDSREQLLKTRTRQRATSHGTIDTQTTSSSAGRSYTVANVNNGVIYLRPIVRAGNQRRALPDPFVYPPQTPPDSATLDSHLLSPSSADWDQSLHGSRTPRSEPTPPLPDSQAVENAFKTPPRAYRTPGSRHTSHVRSHSFSTVDEHTTASVSTEPGTFKVIIERPTFGRPRTADTSKYPLLSVPIPHYRLGTPRFSTRGTPDLRSSIYTRASGTDDQAHSVVTPQRAGTNSFLSTRPRSDAYSPIPYLYRATMDRPPVSTSGPSSARISQAPIGPRVYDALTMNPDNNAVVRLSPAGDILAATPSRLVAHITSPSFLDYELLSDFFLTFRAFLSPKDLVAYLISRLRWAVDRQDDFGRIVRVRTFVALRHWILNYFVDDFVPLYSLRVYFCDLVNSLHSDLLARADGGGGDIKIVGELKKCWRRTCAQYWDTDETIGQGFPDDLLLPGGQADSQSHASYDDIAHIATTLAQTPTTPKRTTIRDTKETVGSNPSDHFASRQMEWNALKSRHTPQNSTSTPHVPSQEYEHAQAPLSPSSTHSMNVLSCSIPMRNLNKAGEAIELPLYPHPVPAGTARVAAVPQQVIASKKGSRPNRGHNHKRSGSFSDALRDSRAPLSIPKTMSSDMAMSAMTNLPGSLVRGGLFQPGSPFFEARALRKARSRLALQSAAGVASAAELSRPGQANSPGMKKIFGTMRRALSTRQSPVSGPVVGTGAVQRKVPSSRSSIPLSSSTLSGARSKQPMPLDPQVRIDILASTVADSFKEAIKSQLEQEQIQHRQQELHSMSAPDLGGFEFEFDKAASPQPDDRAKSLGTQLDPRVYSNITSGSRSILIIDDTEPPPLPEMSGALPVETDEETHESAAPLPTQVESQQASLLYTDSEPYVSTDDQRVSRTTVDRPRTAQRRSMSEGRGHMHSFRRRGSTKQSMSRSGSLRKHASLNSVLSRRQGPESFATFQTMSSDNDPFVFDRQLAGKEAAGPTRQLRRRPGGDLRAADNVHDLEMTPRPHSTGSIRTHSISNSVILRSDKFVQPEGQTTEVTDAEPIKKAISMVATHSSQPNLRPSFEVEVAKLAALPDDTDDDGGIESALMKLEGRYEKKSPTIPSKRTTMEPEVYRPTGAPSSIEETRQPASPEHKNTDDVLHRPLAPPEQDDPGMYRLSAENFDRHVPVGTSVGPSTDSYSSIPLLDRGLSDIHSSPRQRTMDTMRSSAKVQPLQVTGLTPPRPTRAPVAQSDNSSIEYVVETDSMRRIPAGGTLPVEVPRESFLLDEDEDLSDMDSTTTGPRSNRSSHGVRSFFDDEVVSPDPTANPPMHPMRHPPTPPLTGNKLNDPMSDGTVFERGLPTPGLTPTMSRPGNPTFNHPVSQVSSPVESTTNIEALPSTATHLPFVLAYESESLAQQFTIIEKDALDEIDWKELIELRWKQSSPQIRDWVQYLRTEEARGVDVVIARFNLVVKWVVSEIVLTESAEERARCIVKYIHVAKHARKYRNYATMYQIAIALISNDVSRLHKTWALVPANELQKMKELEALVQPLKNFHNLRLEMETATVEDGCIPFIGIYTRDLIYNAQKPAFIDAPPNEGERLVNFDRHHTAATIVKNLLRLLEASSKYKFKVEPNIISKCLWLAALSDDEIAKRSRECE